MVGGICITFDIFMGHIVGYDPPTILYIYGTIGMASVMATIVP
jgi:hypothetical protein